VEALPNLLLLALALGLAVLVLTRGNAARRAVRDTQESLKPGMQVMTGSGLFARIVEVEADAVVLETGPGQHSRWDRRAVIRVVPETTAQDETRDEPDEPGPPRSPTTGD
jgi:preprotein translocase subunit YajC